MSTVNYVGLYKQNDDLTGNPSSPISNNSITIIKEMEDTIYVGLLIKTYKNFNVVLSESGEATVSFRVAILSDTFGTYSSNEEGVLNLNLTDISGTYSTSGTPEYIIPIKVEFINTSSVTLTFSEATFSDTNTTPPTPTYTVSPSRTVPRLIIVNGTPTSVSSKIHKKSNIIVQNNTNTGTTNKEVVLSDKYIIYKLYDEVVDGLIETPDTLPG